MKRVLTFGNHHDAAIGGEKRLRTPINDQDLPGISLQRKTNAEYTIGWLCAVTTEYVAAQLILDEIHEGPEKVSHANQSDYTLGRIGRHNVVIATLPYGEYGTASAATVAADMSHNFPNIKIRLMVGIGGGAPSKRNDIRLGDIVVSAPSNGKSGVLQYDFGKTIQDQPFQPTRFLDQPPMVLRTAMSGLAAQYEREGHRIEQTINEILEKTPRLQEKYGRPHESTDRLYCSTSVHSPDSDLDCETLCGDGLLITRPERTQETRGPKIHYGQTASANQLMKDAIVRDDLSLKYDIICFEMEAGGLMNQFPCLVIRGICDYSDTHKNKAWQGYAAMAAAAYAKDLINRLSPIDSGALQSTNDSSSSQLHLQEETSYTVSAEQINALVESLRFDQIEARQLTIKNAHAKTCRWLLHKSEYIDWLDTAKISEHRGFLWIKGKPGTGKSTLMKFALNSAKKTMRDKTIIYFFFNARGEDLEKSTIGMYRSLLLQLLEKLPGLRNTLELPKLTARPGEEYRWTAEILTNLLDQAIQNLKESSIVCFIDALDECDENQIRNMIKFFERVGESPTAGSFRVCFSSRHYPHVSISKGINLILEGQEGHTQDMISYVDSELKIGNSALANQIRAELQEKSSGVFMWVVLVVNILNKEHDKGRIHVLRKRLQEIPADLHELFRDILTRDRQDADELLLCIQWVLFTKQPLRPEQLYFAMLSNVLYEWNPNEITASDIERFILNSSKGLTEVTKSKSPTVQFIHESVKDYLLKENGLRDIWPDFQAKVNGDSHERLKQCCLNYIAIGKTAYLEMAAKAAPEEAKSQRQLGNASFPFLEYAVKNVLHHANEADAHGANRPEFLKEFPLDDWIQLDNFLERYETRRHKRNVSFLYILAELNMSHLIRRHPDISSFLGVEHERYGTPLFATLAMNSSESLRVFLDAYLEIEPSFRDIVDDYYSDGIEKNSLGRSFKFSRTNSFRDFITKGATLAVAFSFKITGIDVYLDSPNRDDLIIALANGHKSILKLILDKNTYFDNSALLSAALSNGHEAIADFLLDKGAKVDGTDKNGRTFLSIAVEKGFYYFVERSLNSGVELDVQHEGRTPLSYAIQSGSEAMVKLLLERGARINIQDYEKKTPLSYAVQSGSEAMVKLLLDIEDQVSGAPLSHAVQSGNAFIVQLLLDRGAEINTQDEEKKTPLLYGIEKGDASIVQLLLDRGADIDAKDQMSRTPLSYAARFGNASIVQLLLDRGAEINTQDKENITPLLYGVERGDESIVEVLLHKGADLEVKDIYGRTPFLTAYNAAVVKLLLDKGAKVNDQDLAGRTPLSRVVCLDYNAAMVKLLLERGADVNVKDNNGMAPLSYALLTFWGVSDYDKKATIQLLLEKGADVNAKDNDGKTPLLYAVLSNWRFSSYNKKATIQLLLEKGADVNAKDNDGKTPLSHAVLTQNNQDTVQLLLKRGADVNAEDNMGGTPLTYAKGHPYEVQLKMKDMWDQSISNPDDSIC